MVELRIAMAVSNHHPSLVGKGLHLSYWILHDSAGETRADCNNLECRDLHL